MKLELMFRLLIKSNTNRWMRTRFLLFKISCATTIEAAAVEGQKHFEMTTFSEEALLVVGKNNQIIFIILYTIIL